MRIRTSVLAVVFVLGSGCAGLLPTFMTTPAVNLDPLTVAKISDDYLDSIGNAEFEICFSMTVDEAHAKYGFDRVLLGHCTSPLSGIVGLTDARHQKINSALARAYDLHKQLAIDVQGWTPGQPAPLSVGIFKLAMGEVQGVAGQLNPSSNPFIQALVTAASRAVSAASSMYAAVGGK